MQNTTGLLLAAEMTPVLAALARPCQVCYYPAREHDLDERAP